MQKEACTWTFIVVLFKIRIIPPPKLKTNEIFRNRGNYSNLYYEILYND